MVATKEDIFGYHHRHESTRLKIEAAFVWMSEGAGEEKTADARWQEVGSLSVDLAAGVGRDG